MLPWLFQSTPSWRGRLIGDILPYEKAWFQSTPSWRGRPALLWKLCDSFVFQSTPSWRGRQKMSLYLRITKQISIHALVKRATVTAVDGIVGHDISIHALVKRATLGMMGNTGYSFDFNPRPREEGDGINAKGDIIKGEFQSTPSWRGRRFCHCKLHLFHMISIHALVKRATLLLQVEKFHFLISIHALVKRATSFHCLYYTAPLYFNPRPREEGDALPWATLKARLHFNPRPREEGDRGVAKSKHSCCYFNPRPREEGDF